MLRALPLNRSLLGLALLLLGLGVWQLGGAGWIKAKAWVAQVLMDRAWAETLAGEPAVKPWPWADTWPVARLRVPDLNVDLFVLAGASNRNLAFGPAALEGIEGLDHRILSGHRDTHFAFLQHLKEGSRVQIQDPQGNWLSYRVRGRSILDVREPVIARPGDGRELLTLVTCYPFDAVSPGGPLRYAVTAEGIENKASTTSNAITGGEFLGEKAPGQASPGGTN